MIIRSKDDQQSALVNRAQQQTLQPELMAWPTGSRLHPIRKQKDISHHQFLGQGGDAISWTCVGIVTRAERLSPSQGLNVCCQVYGHLYSITINQYETCYLSMLLTSSKRCVC